MKGNMAFGTCGDEPDKLILTNDLIRNLTKKLDDFIARTTWIDANDRLPEEDRRVLVFYGGEATIAMWTNGYAGEGGYSFRFLHLHYGALSNVTHWMPLPEDPPNRRNNP